MFSRAFLARLAFVLREFHVRSACVSCSSRAFRGRFTYVSRSFRMFFVLVSRAFLVSLVRVLRSLRARSNTRGPRVACARVVGGWP